MIKHIVTSGCSFGVSIPTLHYYKWPYHLEKLTNISVYNRAAIGASNSWICRSLIYQTEELLKNNVNAKDILVIPMWSSIDRKGVYLNKNETIDFDEIVSKIALINYEYKNFNDMQTIFEKSGFLENPAWNLTGIFDNDKVLKRIQDWYLFNSKEQLLLESYENFIQIQNYCDAKRIKCINLTFADIFHYPNNPFVNDRHLYLQFHQTKILSKNVYSCIKHYYDMLNLDNWLLYNKSCAQYEWVRDNNYTFDEDNAHPSTESNELYVKQFLIPRLKDKGLLL